MSALFTLLSLISDVHCVSPVSSFSAYTSSLLIALALIVAVWSMPHLDILFSSGTGLYARTFVLISGPAPLLLPFDKVRTTGRRPWQYKSPAECQRGYCGSTLCCATVQLLPLLFGFYIFLMLDMDFLRVCVLGAVLIGVSKSFTHEDMKDALLEKLGLDEVPKIQKRDLENLVIPAHIRNKYMSMLKMHHSRRRRALPSLAGILRGIPGNAGKNHFSSVLRTLLCTCLNLRVLTTDISGEYVYSDTTRHRMVFEMEARIDLTLPVELLEFWIC